MENKENQPQVSGWMEKAEARIEIRKYAKEMFDKYAIYKDNPIAWSIWKIAFSVALNPQFIFPENQSQPILQDNVMDWKKDLYKWLHEYYPVFTSNMAEHQKDHRMDFGLGYEKAVSFFQDRITSLETANAFHKKAAEDAVQEQWRLQKELEEISNQQGKEQQAEWQDYFDAVNKLVKAAKTINKAIQLSNMKDTVMHVDLKNALKLFESNENIKAS